MPKSYLHDKGYNQRESLAILRASLLVATGGKMKFMGIDGDNTVDFVVIRTIVYIMIASIFSVR